MSSTDLQRTADTAPLFVAPKPVMDIEGATAGFLALCREACSKGETNDQTLQRMMNAGLPEAFVTLLRKELDVLLNETRKILDVLFVFPELLKQETKDDLETVASKQIQEMLTAHAQILCTVFSVAQNPTEHAEVLQHLVKSPRFLEGLDNATLHTVMANTLASGENNAFQAIILRRISDELKSRGLTARVIDATKENVWGEKGLLIEVAKTEFKEADAIVVEFLQREFPGVYFYLNKRNERYFDIHTTPLGKGEKGSVVRNNY